MQKVPEILKVDTRFRDTISHKERAYLCKHFKSQTDRYRILDDSINSAIVQLNRLCFPSTPETESILLLKTKLVEEMSLDKFISLIKKVVPDGLSSDNVYLDFCNTGDDEEPPTLYVSTRVKNENYETELKKYIDKVTDYNFKVININKDIAEQRGLYEFFTQKVDALYV